MRTIRRVYIYAVAFISLEVITWGLISLVRSVFSGGQVGGDVAQLAGALALILVGVPVFLLHWWLAQRGSRADEDERSARTRAFFLYGALLGTLLPIAQNALALINRIWLLIFDLPASTAIFGQDQNLADNIIAIVMNALIAAYIYWILRQDWEAQPQGDDFAETRRLYRYIWQVYGLALVVGGAIQVLSFIFQSAETVGRSSQGLLPNGLALLLVGLPIWLWSWRITQRSLADPAEKSSQIRLILLYALSLIAMGSVLASAGQVLFNLLLPVFGAGFSFSEFLFEIGDPLSVAIAFGIVWVYYGRTLNIEVDALPDTPRRAGLRRLYYYILSAFGLGATFIGLVMLLTFLIEFTSATAFVLGVSLRENLCAALATLLVGLPLWIISWRPMVREAAAEGEAGDHARRSVVRKLYLYLALFAGVIGIMASAGMLFFNLLSALLGDPPSDLASEALELSKNLILFVLLLLYHGQALRTDNQLANASLAAKHAEFPVLVMTTEIGEFSESVVAALQRETPALPVAVHVTDNGPPDETLSEAKAVILPAELVTNPSEATRIWLQSFSGERLILPTESIGWQWIFGSGQPLTSLVRQAARAVRHLAEGEDIPNPRTVSGWTVLLYVLGGLVGIPLVLSLISLFFEFLM